MSTCPEILVGFDVLLQAHRMWTCAQREGHPGPHNERVPSDGCTAWADHCPGCAEHDGHCRCDQVRPITVQVQIDGRLIRESVVDDLYRRRDEEEGE